MLSAPAGSPASAKISPQSVPPVTGDHSDGLSTTVLPYASGAVIERNERISAAFHGAIAPTTPTGWRNPIAIAPGTSDGITSPIGAYATAAACRNRPGVKMVWNIPNPNVQPVSRASRPTISSRRLSRMSAARRKTCWRTAGGAAAHSGNAAAAPDDSALGVRARACGSPNDDVPGVGITDVERGAVLGVRPLAGDEEP